MHHTIAKKKGLLDVIALYVYKIDGNMFFGETVGVSTA